MSRTRRAAAAPRTRAPAPRTSRGAAGQRSRSPLARASPWPPWWHGTRGAAPALRVRRGCGRRDNPTWLIVWRSPRPASLERACCCNGTVRRMHDDGYFDEAVAARYDELERQRFAHDEIDAAADLLVELAAGGRALEFAIGPRRSAPPPAARGGGGAGHPPPNPELAPLAP